MKNIGIRVDASLNIGSGHVMRCLTLANKLRESGAKVQFICCEHSGNKISYIEQQGFKCSLLPIHKEIKPYSGKGRQIYKSWLGGGGQHQDAEDTIEVLRNTKLDWLIVDHYALDSEWHHIVRPYVNKIMVIDDLADRDYDCDLLLDQTFQREKADYKSLVAADTTLLIGSKYALLRTEFSEMRSKAIEKRKNFISINHILISMGGADLSNYSSRILCALSNVEWKNGPSITVVLSETSPFYSEVKKLAKDIPLDITVLSEVSNMAELMLKADIAIGACGATSWERASLGLPSMLIQVAENQEFAMKKLVGFGAIIPIMGEGKKFDRAINKALADLSDDIDLYDLMVDANLKICDALGAILVAKEITER